MKTHMIGGFALLLSLGGIAATPAPPHITPTVVLRKQADVIRGALPDASQYFQKNVTIGQDDFRQLKEEAGFEPDEHEVSFYYGTGSDGSVRGTVLFPQVNTQHGPLEIGLMIRPDGTIGSVNVTKATVETKPWVQTAINTGFLARFVGMNADSDPEAALEGLSKSSLGEMPYYMAGLVAESVERGLALYRTLYEGSAE
jgi:hypothetical protein